MKVIRFPAYVDLRAARPTPNPWERFLRWLNPPQKAQVFKFKNPTQWKLERVRKKARGAL